MAASAGSEGLGVVIGGWAFRQVGHVQVQRDVGGLNSPRCEMTCGRSVAVVVLVVWKGLERVWG